MPSRPRDGLVFPASSSELVGGVEPYKSITPSSAKTWLWPHGECRLVKNSTNLEVQRVGLGRVIVNGKLWQLSTASPPALAPTGASAGTTYNIFLYESSGSLALEYSTTAYALDTSSGIITKSGDTSRTFVGQAHATTGPAWIDTAAFRYVLSYFNRRQRSLYVPLTADKTPATTTAEITTASERAYFLSWADAPVAAGAIVNTQQGSGGTGLFATLNVDGTVASIPYTSSIIISGAGYYTHSSIPTVSLDVSEGLHYIGLHAYCTGTASSKILGATSPSSAIIGAIWG